MLLLVILKDRQQVLTTHVCMAMVLSHYNEWHSSHVCPQLWHVRGCSGARVVAKAHAGERVGVFARRAGRLEVVEYSELDPDQAAATDPRAPTPGRVTFACSRRCALRVAHTLASALMRNWTPPSRLYENGARKGAAGCTGKAILRPGSLALLYAMPARSRQGPAYLTGREWLTRHLLAPQGITACGCCRHGPAALQLEQRVHALLQHRVPGGHGDAHARGGALPPSAQGHPVRLGACAGRRHEGLVFRV